MRTSERVRRSRFPVESAGLTPVASPAEVPRRATATDAAPRIVFAICALAVAARFIFINQPYVDHWSWRQNDVAAIARNFLENGFRFGNPQIDWAGDAAGYVGTELPILPFVAALCYKFTGVHEWIGRIQAVILFAISLPFFFVLVREIFGSTAAVWATFFYSFAPLSIFAGRSFMPDVPSLSLAIVGLYFFLRWVEHGEASSFLLAAIAISLSFLIKITSIVIVAPLVYIVVGRLCQTPGISQKRPTIVGLIAFAAIALIPSATWYWHAYQIAQEFYPHHFFGAGGIRIESFWWYWQIAQQTLVSGLTPALSVMALVGLFVAPRSRYSRFFHWWLAAMILFIIIVGYGNRHRWYQLPVVPILAAFAGAGCAFVGSRIPSRFAKITSPIVLAATFLIFAVIHVRPFYESSAAQLRDAGLELKKVTVPNALIVAADMGDPTILYYAERKGWHFLENGAIYNGNPDDSEQAIENLERLRHGGATHFVFTKNTFWWTQSYPEFVAHLISDATLIEATPEFRIYKLGTAVR
ncbi:MAG TPA: glycosyltransferase family 39 protein [Candidatus Udaeobacter sp.]|nr:glycosyltransferase family 39 protein [Candidatus Udaeobacter sp.]